MKCVNLVYFPNYSIPLVQCHAKRGLKSLTVMPKGGLVSEVQGKLSFGLKPTIKHISFLILTFCRPYDVSKARLIRARNNF